MAVYRRGYQRYQGPLMGDWNRLFVLPRFACEGLMQQGLVATFWPIACALFVYLSHHLELLQGFGGDAGNFLQINGDFFFVFMNAQSVFAIILSALSAALVTMLVGVREPRGHDGGLV